MRVRILTATAPYPAGHELELDDVTAQAWIGSGRAELVADRQAPIETTLVEPVPESAVSRSRRPRTRDE